MAGALGMLICFVDARDARDDGDARYNPLQFEAASCKGRVERPSGGCQACERMPTLPFLRDAACRYAITAIALLQRVVTMSNSKALG